jgi:hypothetical protein
LATLLKSQRVVDEDTARPEPTESDDDQSGLAQTVVGLASSIVQRGKQSAVSESTPQRDLIEQITKLASLHSAGVLTVEEFA